MTVLDDLDWDSFLASLSYETLELLETKIKRRKSMMHPERIARKIIIRKIEE